MELASALAQVALGAAALMPSAKIERKPPQVHVYLAQWQNSLPSQVSFEIIENPYVPDSAIPLLTLPVGTTDINKAVEIKKNAVWHYAPDNYILQNCIHIKPHENNDFSLKLRCNRHVSQTDTNYVNIRLSWLTHTRQVAASCPIFDEQYEWEPEEPLKDIYLLISGKISGQEMKDSTLSVQEIRCARVPTLLELTLPVIINLIDEKKIDSGKIPTDVHESLENMRLIKNLNQKNK